MTCYPPGFHRYQISWHRVHWFCCQQEIVRSCLHLLVSGHNSKNRSINQSVSQSIKERKVYILQCHRKPNIKHKFTRKTFSNGRNLAKIYGNKILVYTPISPTILCEIGQIQQFHLTRDRLTNRSDIP